MGYFQVRYDSRVVIYDRRGFIRLATGIFNRLRCDSFQGITQEHLDMLGPLICHTIRPLVFRAGLWSIEVEKSWTHLFDMVTTTTNDVTGVVSYIHYMHLIHSLHTLCTLTTYIACINCIHCTH